MNRILGVCLAGLILAASGVAVNGVAAQTLQKGISVEMAVTANATPMPEADKEDAWIVAITADGRLFFGVEPVTPVGLADKMMKTPRNREAKLYIKADAQAPFADVEKVLQAGRTVWFEAPVLLTSQPESVAPGTMISPKGLEVLVGAPASPGAIVVQISKSRQPSPRLTANGEDVSETSLPGMLRRMLQPRSEKLVVLKADGQLPFAQVAHVIDECRGAGAKVAVGIPEL